MATKRKFEVSVTETWAYYYVIEAESEDEIDAMFEDPDREEELPEYWRSECTSSKVDIYEADDPEES
jgi:hypothetical protein